ncbi:MAG: phage holin family protein [Bacteroidota bacterium]|nr:phage holin family protein [Bacteroidota bacterium]
MENQSTSIETLIERVKSYVETRIDLLKLKAIDKSSSFLSLLITMIVVILIALIFFIFLNIGIALYLGDLLGKSYFGFFIIAGFYIIAGLVIFSLRVKLLKTPIINAMIKKLVE